MEHLVSLLARLEDLANRVEALERAIQGKRRGVAGWLSNDGSS